MEELTKSISSDVPFDAMSMLLQLVFSLCIGLGLALHPSRWNKIFKKNKRLEVAKAQILLCVAGAILINVIGDSAARAFGIFGIGSFVRFRAPVRSAMDASIMFLLLGLGMAIGLKLYLASLMCFVFLFVLLFPINLLQVKKDKDLDSE